MREGTVDPPAPDTWDIAGVYGKSVALLCHNVHLLQLLKLASVSHSNNAGCPGLDVQHHDWRELTKASRTLDFPLL